MTLSNFGKEDGSIFKKKKHKKKKNVKMCKNWKEFTDKEESHTKLMTISRLAF